MPKLTWTDDRFGGSEAVVSQGLRLGVHYERIERLASMANDWNVWVFGCKLKLRSASKQEAQERAERCAAAWLKAALGVLGEQECPAQPLPAQP